jgi:hypothetical protein
MVYLYNTHGLEIIYMKELTPREFGSKLEKDIVNAFESIGLKAKRTNGSGNQMAKGDVQVEDLFICEAKARNTKDITVKSDVWNKLKSEIPLHSKRLPLYILRNQHNDTLVCLDLNDFIEILKKTQKEG